MFQGITKVKTIILVLLSLISRVAFTQGDLYSYPHYSLQITLEQQSYLEKSYHDSKYFDVEKSAGICVSYTFNFDKTITISENLFLSYGFGAKVINQNFNFTEMESSDWEYLEMGYSNTKGLYLNGSTKILFRKSSSKKVYSTPFIGCGLNFLAAKYENLSAEKSGYSSMIDPEFRFKKVIPECSLGLLFFVNPANSKFGFAFGPSVNTNGKYFREKVGILSIPFSLSANLLITNKR